jgi:hypothetical protein
MKKKLQQLLFLFLLFSSQLLKAQFGTHDVSPNEINLTGLAVQPSVASGSYLNCPKDNRIYIHIKDSSTEKLYFGFRPHYYQNFTIGGVTKPIQRWCADSIYIKIFRPDSSVAFTAKLDTTVGSAGFINNYIEASAGPKIGTFNPTGYIPLILTPTINGDYWINLYYSHDGGVTMETITSTNTWLKFPYFDLTIANAANVKFPGRIFSSKWDFVAMSNKDSTTGTNTLKSTDRFVPDVNASSEAIFYSFNKDSVVTKIDFDPGFRPIAYNFAVNDYGVNNGGNWLVDRQSINAAAAPSLLGGYKIFLNDPDSTVYPSGTVPGNATFPEPTVKGCPPSGPYKLRYKLPANADVVILLDINGTAGYQPSTTDRAIEQPARLAGTNFYSWDGKDGLGNQMAANATLTFSVSTYFQKGKASVPLYDAEINKAGFKIVGIRPIATTALRMFWDDSQLTNVGACAATPGATSQQNNLTGVGIANIVTGSAAPAHAWNGTGNSAETLPAPNATYCSSTTVNDSTKNAYQWDDFGNVRTINTWAYGIESYMSKVIKLQCVNVSGTVYNDADGSAGGTFTNINTGTEAGTNAGTLYAAIIDPDTREVVAYAVVAANGTYTINGIAVNSTGLQVVITSTLPVVDGILPTETMPTGWLNTSPSLNTFNTGIVNVTGLNFGLNRLPESAVTLISGLNNPPGNVNIAVPAGAFQSSNVGTNPSTQDYDGGTVTNIRITAFPSGANTITINGVKYGTCPTCTAWPVGGVITPFTNGVGPTNPILVDPIDGVSTVVIIPFVAIDNTGKEDATPGSVTMNFLSVLYLHNVIFTANKQNEKSMLTFIVEQISTNSMFIIERSINGLNFNSIGSLAGTTLLQYNFIDAAPIYNEKNYYRIKEIDVQGKISYSSIRFIQYNKDGSIEIYPIPARDEINISLNDALQAKPITVKIYNAQGVEVLRKIIKKTSSTETFDIKILPAGVYNVWLGNETNEIKMKRIIVIK